MAYRHTSYPQHLERCGEAPLACREGGAEQLSAVPPPHRVRRQGAAVEQGHNGIGVLARL